MVPVAHHVVLVGLMGSGKTTVGTSLLGYSRPGALISAGKVLLGDRDVLKLPWKQVRQLRGEEIAYVPQDPASALNPSIRIGKQIVEHGSKIHTLIGCGAINRSVAGEGLMAIP